jgi:hypothetical protein
MYLLSSDKIFLFPRNTQDVAAVVNFARRNGFQVCIQYLFCTVRKHKPSAQCTPVKLNAMCHVPHVRWNCRHITVLFTVKMVPDPPVNRHMVCKRGFRINLFCFLQDVHIRCNTCSFDRSYLVLGPAPSRETTSYAWKIWKSFYF